jgi:hypothetical protein
MALISVSCTSVKKEVWTKKYTRHPIHTQLVHVFSPNDLLPEHFRVAMLLAKGELPADKMITALRKEAGKLGANAIVLLEEKVTTIKDVLQELPSVAISASLGIQPETPRARVIEAIAIFCPSFNQ